ncbi:MAG: zinc ribbon domain-containing protein [bacterium]
MARPCSIDLRERHRLKQSNRRVFLLSGILRCGDCGRALIGQASHGKNLVHRYYGHKLVAGEVLKCKFTRFRADEVEEAVINHLDEVLLRSGYLDQIERNLEKISGERSKTGTADKSRLERQLKVVEGEIDSVFQLHAQMSNDPSVSVIIRERLDKLADRKRTLNHLLETLKVSSTEGLDAKAARGVLESRVREFQGGWRKATPVIKKRLLRRVIQNLVFTGDGLKTYYVLSPEKAIAIQSENKNGTPGANPGVPSYVLKRPSVLILDQNASSFYIGGGGGS